MLGIRTFEPNFFDDPNLFLKTQKDKFEFECNKEKETTFFSIFKGLDQNVLSSKRVEHEDQIE